MQQRDNKWMCPKSSAHPYLDIFPLEEKGLKTGMEINHFATT